MRLPLSTLEIFDAIVQNGNLRAAAAALGVKPSTVSHQLKHLEELVGTRLFIRTTRSIDITEAGRALARSTGPAFEQLSEGLDKARSTGSQASGALKLAIPEFAYFLLVEQKLATFQQKYPEIEVELRLTDALTDILEDGFHAGFRLGGLIAQDMIADALTGTLPTVVAASPEYLSRYGVPREPNDLLGHNCLRYRFQSSGMVAPWAFSGPEGEFEVTVEGNLISGSWPITREMAKIGQGLTFGFRDYCHQALEDGELVEVLADYRTTRPGINIYYPREYRDMLPLKLFIRHLKEDG